MRYKTEIKSLAINKKGKEKDKDTGHRLVSPSLSYHYKIILVAD
jgi:hypothetical protein